MSDFVSSRIRAFRYAFAGWWYVMRTQRNAWIHATATVLAVVLGLWLGLNLREWLFIIVAITMVWEAEFINTALEVAVDLASPQQHRLAKIGKDVGAAAVLIAAGSSAVIGIIIYWPLLWSRLHSLAIK
jgi:diacylglycerol kinase (ATP)